MDSGRARQAVAAPAGGTDDLRVLGAVTAALASGDFGACLHAAAEVLRTAAEADDCEIYLCEPDGQDVVLAASTGGDRDVLCERTRFEQGAGFPGISVASRRPLATRYLNRDRRFLRRRAVGGGISAFVSAPLPGPQGPMGCATLAWRTRDARIEDGAHLLALSGHAIATAVRAALLGVRERVGQAVEARGGGRERCARACLDAAMRESDARAGSLALYDSDGGETLVVQVGATAGVCANAADGRVRCSVLAQGHGVVLDRPRCEWPESCQCLPAGSDAPLCLPLRHAGRLHGVLVLDRGTTASAPASQDLVPLLTMAHEVAARLAPLDVTLPTRRPNVAPTDAMLEVRCFGAFGVRLQQQAIQSASFTRKKAITLLKVLILGAGKPVRRDELAERLWPGIDPNAAANRLHGVVHALRNAIEPFRRQGRWIYVCNVGELYFFNLESPHWIDVYEFRRGLARAYDAEGGGRTAEAIREVEAALALYRGDLFADDPYSSWCELERVELRHRYVDHTAHAAELWDAAGDAARGVAWLRRGLRVDPVREDLHQALIRSLLALGLRGDARAQYLECARALREELDVAPLPETRKLGALVSAVPEVPRPPRDDLGTLRAL